MKKTLAITLAAAMILVLLPVTALAVSPIDTAAALADAITAAGSGDTIQLTADITGIQQMEISKTITIDMNGFSISGTPASYTAFRVVAGGNLILDNTSATQSRLLVATGHAAEYNYEGIRIAGGGQATVRANVSIETGLPVFIYGNGTPDSARLDVYGKLLVSAPISADLAYSAIQGNGTAGKGGTVINIYNGAEIINPYSAALYIPQDGVVNVFGGTITAKSSAIALKAGTLNISGGTLRATGPATIPTTGYSDGVNASGCAIQIESNDTYAGNIVVNITGGTIISSNGYAIYEYLDAGNAATEVTSISISGGSFHSATTLAGDILTSTEFAGAAGKLSVTGGIFSKGGSTEVTAGVDPTYTIIIPTAVDFGTLVKDSGLVTKPFNVTAQAVCLESDANINVTVTSDFLMDDGVTATLAYSLYNAASGGSALETGDRFALFGADGTQNGRVVVDTADIPAAGSYSDTMTFIITYVD